MPTINTAASASVAITTPIAYVNVDCTSGAIVEASWSSPGGVTGRMTVQNASQDIGPFADSTTLVLSCRNGTASYTEYNNGTQQAAMQSLVSGARISLPLASGDPMTDYTAIMQAIASVGAYGTITAPPGQTYLLGRELVPLTGQTLRWSGSALKLPNQVSSTLTGSAALSSAGANQTVSVPVTSSTGFYVGQRVALEDQTVGGQKTISSALGLVTAVASGSVTVQFTNGIGDTMARTVVTATWAETSNTSYTFPSGAYLCSISRMILANQSLAGIVITDLEIDGNRGNNPLGLRWETSPMLDIRATRSKIADLWVHDAPTDAIYHGANGLIAENLRIDKPGAMGMHIGDAASGIYGGKRTIITGIIADSPGMGTPHIGHYGGSAAHPNYPAIGFSRNTDHIIIQAAHITNDSGVQGTTWGSAIGCITGSDNNAIEFSDIYIKDFNKGIGAITLLYGSSTATQLDFNNIHVENCGPITTNALNIWEIPSLGYSASGNVNASKVRFRNSNFIDSPLALYDCQDVTLENVTFDATTIGGTATPNFLGTNTTLSTTVLRNVTSRRVVTTSGNNGSIPTSPTYSANFYCSAAKVSGSGVQAINGTYGLISVGASDWEVSGFRWENMYQNGVRAAGGSTAIMKLTGLVGRQISGYSYANTFIGFDCNSSTGASGQVDLVAPLIDMVTTNASQSCLRLCPTAAVPCTVTGGKLKVSGASTTPIQSGGATGIGIVQGTLLSHAFTPGAAETNNSVVNANA